MSFVGLAIVALVAFAAPLLLGLQSRLRLPAVVLEIALGIVIGPSLLGWVKPDDVPVRVLALFGLSYLLFLAGLEIEFHRLKGRTLNLALVGFGVSFALALLAGQALGLAGLVQSPLLVAIILSATALGLIVPLLKDLGETASVFGQLVIAGASIADFATVILLSLFFSREAGGAGSQLLLLGSLLLASAAVMAVAARAGRSSRLSRALLKLQDTSAQIRVRGAFLLLVALVALAEHIGLELILGAFMAGAILTLIDHDQAVTHPLFRSKLEAIGFGVFIPVFFVTSGIRFNLRALLESREGLVQIPVFLLALLLVRGLPALLYRRLVGGRRAVAAGLLQATSLSFVVAASQIGIELEQLSETTGAALVAAALLSVLFFPLAAATLLGGMPAAPHDSSAR